ncbi:ferredoxin--NADP reductase [Motiliproteus sp. MSK22-1]|uniref:ferredoxin--NADP reductase n=1 Tax=Motiliproteus sp. MSK22-1 TaxID=1897630 RepID=UPI000977F385|nr:ferredoxin--NADP reductase [Motiliproteus sp. MSK22-1]OMH33688.1 ferredoxin--NADP(+) reductase [Motiliproteus sp. MSK22-1]
MSEWIQATVLNNKRWNEHLHSLQIEAEGIKFTAGQYTRLALDIDEVRVARPYSFVNPPDVETLEFYLNSVPDGPLSNRLVNMNSGDRIWVSTKPAGFLTLDEVPDGQFLWMLATGTAIGPFLSILRTKQPWNRFQRVLLAYAVRNENELSYRDLLEQFSKQHSEQFTWVPFVSRESLDYGLSGRIPTALDDGSLEEYFKQKLNRDTQVMICGNPHMVKDSISSLKAKGLSKNLRHTPGHITVERYW